MPQLETLVQKFGDLWQGKRYYFIGEETRQEFARQNEVPVQAWPP